MSEKLLKISLTIKVNKGREWKYTYPLMITPQWRRKQIDRRGGDGRLIRYLDKQKKGLW